MHDHEPQSNQPLVTEAMENRLRYAINEALFQFGVLPEFINFERCDWEPESLTINLGGIVDREEWARLKRAEKLER